MELIIPPFRSGASYQPADIHLPLSIDWRRPETNGLVSFVDLISGVDLVSGVGAASIGGKLTGTKNGLVRSFLDNTDDGVLTGSKEPLPTVYTLFIKIYSSYVSGYPKPFVRESVNNNAPFVEYNNSSTSMTLRFKFTGGNKLQTFSVPGLGNLFWLAISHDASAPTNDATIYIDGSAVSTTTNTPTGTPSQSIEASFRIGSVTGSPRAWKGYVGPVAIFNKLSTQQQIINFQNCVDGGTIYSRRFPKMLALTSSPLLRRRNRLALAMM